MCGSGVFDLVFAVSFQQGHEASCTAEGLNLGMKKS